MKTTTHRKASPQDAAQITDMLRRMLIEMVPFGGRPVCTNAQEWAGIQETIRGRLDLPTYLFLLAVEPQKGASVGYIEARTEDVFPVYEPQTFLHISTLYVDPAYRKQGIANGLLQAALDWGKQNGCIDAELRVLKPNPARNLYRTLGFRDIELRMTRKLD